MIYVNRIREALNLHFQYVNDSILTEGTDELRSEVIRMIKSDAYWERNNYGEFLASRDKSDKPEFFTPYTAQQLEAEGVQTYKLKGFDIGYALVPTPSGKIDIISVFNNDPNVRGIVDYILDSAISHGGNCLDHYDTKLSDFYQRNGFEEKQRYKWDDQYMSPLWDKKKWGEPDVVYRELNPQLRHSLQLTQKL